MSASRFGNREPASVPVCIFNSLTKGADVDETEFRDGAQMVFVTIVIAFAGFLTGAYVAVENYRGAAITSGCAGYNQQTSDFEWYSRPTT